MLFAITVILMLILVTVILLLHDGVDDRDSCFSVQPSALFSWQVLSHRMST